MGWAPRRLGPFAKGLLALGVTGALALALATAAALDARRRLEKTRAVRREAHELLSATPREADRLLHLVDEGTHWHSRLARARERREQRARELRDGWGHPLRLGYEIDARGPSPEVGRILVWSIGPNGIDEFGRGDDVTDIDVLNGKNAEDAK